MGPIYARNTHPRGTNLGPPPREQHSRCRPRRFLSRRVVCAPESWQLRRSSFIRDGGAGFSRPADTIRAPAVFLCVRIRRFASLTFKQVSTSRIDVIRRRSDVPRKTRDALSWPSVRGVSSVGNGLGGRADGCVGLAGTSRTPQYGLAGGETRPRADGNVASVHRPVRENGRLATRGRYSGPLCAYSVPRTPSILRERGTVEASAAHRG